MELFFLKVLITLYWLGRKAQSNPYYNGPYLNLKAFENLLGQALTKVRKLYLYETTTLTSTTSHLPLSPSSLFSTCPLPSSPPSMIYGGSDWDGWRGLLLNCWLCKPPQGVSKYFRAVSRVYDIGIRIYFLILGNSTKY